MANGNRGEVTLQVGENEETKTYTLRYSANALCDLEDAINMPVLQITDMMTDPRKISMKLVRAMLWAGLKEKHPNITILQAGDIVQKLSLSRAYSKIEEAFRRAFPEANVEGENPQELDGQVPAGTGPASIKAGSN